MSFGQVALWGPFNHMHCQLNPFPVGGRSLLESAVALYVYVLSVTSPQRRFFSVPLCWPLCAAPNGNLGISDWLRPLGAPFLPGMLSMPSPRTTRGCCRSEKWGSYPAFKEWDCSNSTEWALAEGSKGWICAFQQDTTCLLQQQRMGLIRRHKEVSGPEPQLPSARQLQFHSSSANRPGCLLIR